MRRKTYKIDAACFTSRKDTHLYLKKVFKNCEYYGNSLDALHDVLTSMMRPTNIKISNFAKAKETLGEYADSLTEVFEDSAKRNENLNITFEE